MSENSGAKGGKGKDEPIRLGTKRKTFSEYVCAVARSTATFASTMSMEGRRLVRPEEEVEDMRAGGEEEQTHVRKDNVDGADRG